jgi:hypothetical protein
MASGAMASIDAPVVLRVGTLSESRARSGRAYYSDPLKPAETRLLMGLSGDRDPATSPIYEAVTEPYRRCRSAEPFSARHMPT